MVMALAVLLGFGVLFMFAFDEGFQGGELSDEALIVQQGKEIDSYRMSIDKGQQKLDLTPQRLKDSKEVSRLGVESQTLQQNIVSLTDKEKATEAEIVEKRKAFDAYKDEYRAYVRSKAKGTEMEQLVTQKGVVYKGVMIRDVTAIGIQIRHEEGQKRVDYEDLPADMQDYYQFDAAQKEAEIANEETVRKTHNKDVLEADKLAEIEMGKQREREALLDKEKRRRQIAGKEADINALQAEIRALGAEIDRLAGKPKSGGPGLDKTKALNRTIKSKQNQIAAIRDEIRLMRASL
ncbi:hypothetical protein [Luteolibacter yonseiensis]